MNKIAIEIKWGIIFSISALLWMFLEKSLGWHDKLIGKQPFYTLLFGIVAILIFILAIQDKKRNYFKNDMDWKQGFITGCIISLIAALLSPLSQYIIYTFISPNFFQNAINFAVENKRMSLESAEAYFNLKSHIFQAVSDRLSIGIVTSAIVAYFMKTK